MRRGIGTSPNARCALEPERLLEFLLDDLLVIREEEMYEEMRKMDSDERHAGNWWRGIEYEVTESSY